MALSAAGPMEKQSTPSSPTEHEGHGQPGELGLSPLMYERGRHNSM